MDPIIATLFSGETPSLIFSAGTASAAGPVLRAGLLDERAARQSAQDLAGRMTPESQPVFQGLLLLWHDHWSPAHEIAQSREGEPDHDLLHAILHRREGDFANAGYWFRGAGKHACYPILERNLASADPGRFQAVTPAGVPVGIPAGIPGMEGGRWSPSAFLASVRKRVQSGQAETSEGSVALRLIQAEEFRAFAAFLLSA
jgi:hypothetical protein